MKKMFAAAIAALLLLSGCSSSAETEGPAISVTNGYARATDEMSLMMGVLMTGVFMDITNNGSEDVTLVGGSSPAAETVEVHEVVGGMMRPKEGGLVIPAGGTETLKPGGNHVMLIGMSDQLAAGDEVEVTLEFSNGESLTITVPVKVVNLEQEHYDSASPSPSESMTM